MVTDTTSGIQRESVADRLRRQARAFHAGRLVGGEDFAHATAGSIHTDADSLLVSRFCADVLRHAELASLRGRFEAKTVYALPSLEAQQRIIADLTRPELGFEARLECGENSAALYLAWPEPE